MKTLNVNYQTKDVKIYIENNLIDNLSNLLDIKGKYFIITDKTVANLYLDKLTKLISNYYVYIIEESELSKNIYEVEKIISSMLKSNISKNDYIISFGGGVVGDISAFVASIYKRGIKYINIPTTLLAQVDSSLGGKCGVDFEVDGVNYKNQIGSIYHPQMIIIDPSLLKTLPKEEYLSGMGEVIKYGICFDKGLFDSLFKDFNLENVILRCLIIKAKITSSDEFDTNERLKLNFGHTIAHIIEGLSNYQITHGQAVAIGMLYEINNHEIKSILIELYKKLDINYHYDLKKDDIIKHLIQDKKISQQEIKLPVLNEIGNVTIISKSIEDFLRGL